MQVDGISRNRVAKIDAHTGAVDPTFIAQTNAAVESIATDGTSVWIGGDFATVGGVSSPRLTKLDAVTGAVDTAWLGTADGSVLDIELAGNDLWVGGNFDVIAGLSLIHI